MARSRFPDSLVLIFGLIVLAQVATYLLPPGEFQREDRRVLPGTYAPLEADPLAWHASLSLIPKGMEAAAPIIFFVFIVGGAVGVLRATGALDALIGGALRRMGGRPVLLAGGMTALFAVGSSTIGLAEEYIAFIPLLVTLCLALKMDAVVALGIVYAGYGIGYGFAAINPFTVLIAQDIAGLPPTSGQGFRWFFLALCLPIGVHHVLAYGRRVRGDPARSLVAGVDYSEGFALPGDSRLTPARLGVLAAFAGGVALFVYGVAAWGWYLGELSAVFLGLALLGGILGALSPNRIAREFCAGAAAMTTTALLIGFARTIEQVLSEGRVIDTVVHGISQPLEGIGPQGAALGMLAVQSACNLFIPSGSGQAFVTMPLMAPLADLTGLHRQVAVLAYQLGDGLTNMVVPTNAVLMGTLGLARVPYGRWLRFVLPLLGKLFVVAVLALVLAVQFPGFLGFS